MQKIERFHWVSTGPGILLPERPRILPSLGSLTKQPEKPCAVCGTIHGFIKEKVCTPFVKGEDTESCATDFEQVFTKGIRGELDPDERKSQFRELFKKWGVTKPPSLDTSSVVAALAPEAERKDPKQWGPQKWKELEHAMTSIPCEECKDFGLKAVSARSEERRVGKECRL